MITTFYPPYNFGGDGIYVYRLANELAKRGHSVDIIHCKDSFLIAGRKSSYPKFPNHPNVKVHGLKSRFGILSPLLTQQTGFPFLKNAKIEKILKSKKFDVIHYHNISLVGGPKILRPRKEVTLYTLHEHWLICPMHVLWKYNREVCLQPSCFLCSLAWKKPPQLWRYTTLLQKAIKNVDCFIAPSVFTMDKHIESGLKIPIINIPQFLPSTDVVNRNTERWKDRSVKPYFLFVGRLEKIKGLQKIIPVFKRYNKVDLLVAGEGTYKKTLMKLSGNNNNIKFLGLKGNEELDRLYEDAVAVIVPSICYETFGMTVIEAFSKRTPVIVNNCGSLPEIVEKSGGGLVYSNDSELIKAIDVFYNQPEEREKFGESGYEAFKKYWTEENHLKLYFNLIEKIKLQRENV